jgi:hypothetical protein
MGKRRGLLAVLGTIAVGVSLSTIASSPARAQDVNVIIEAFPADIVEACKEILEAKTVEDFEKSDFAMAAFNNESDRCHELALRWYAMLTGEEDTAAIGDDTGDTGEFGTGYQFG